MTARTRTLPYFAALGITLVFAGPIRAQDVTVAPPPAPVAADSVVPAPTNVGPTASAATVGVRRDFADSKAPAPYAPKGGYGQSVALMVVGGAAVITGLVIGGGAGYAISVGGAVVGLLGLYQYLQ